MRDSTYSYSKEYSQEFRYQPFVVKLNRCIGSRNALNELSNKICVPNKTEDLDLNELKTLTKHILCEC